MPLGALGCQVQSSVGASVSPGPVAATSLLLPLCHALGDEGSAEPASPVAISCPIRRAIKNNRHSHCPGPAAAAGDAEVAARKINQFPALVGKNNSISVEQESCLGLQSPGQ